MRILVQKFGGSSVADLECMKKVRTKVLAALEEGYKVVVVLSARYGQFDRRTSRYALDGNLRSGPRSLQYMSQIRSQPVGKVHHRSDGPLLSEPSAFAHVRFRVEMSRDELRSGPAFPKIG